ncbi:2'-5' RNA ligase family protein [Sinorhizobium sp. 8-89]|uniref:2'-5' RNA ligase family protein n=1 Tax=Sinorhizobium sp. 7-81 TaxID=3049087 RepID=UPI0024C2E0AB|nr:2'-5' RNA ligase family protein [Sinorhizobium sp. 7-81]MDK1384033.1 2'-5' RNA ligase family protein [Sinorhizobium sp. 7-81]
MDQLSFGFDTRPAPVSTDLLYFAVLPEPAAAERLIETGRRLKKKYGLSGRLYPPERLHVSLVGLGRFSGLPEVAVSAACRIGSRIAASPFDVTFDRAASFRTGSSRALVMRCREGAGALQAIHRQIIGSLDCSSRPFEPHLTLFYDDYAVPEVRLEPITWTVRDIVLVHSLYGRGRHRHLRRWPLAA